MTDDMSERDRLAYQAEVARRARLPALPRSKVRQILGSLVMLSGRDVHVEHDGRDLIIFTLDPEATAARRDELRDDIIRTLEEKSASGYFDVLTFPDRFEVQTRLGSSLLDQAEAPAGDDGYSASKPASSAEIVTNIPPAISNAVLPPDAWQQSGGDVAAQIAAQQRHNPAAVAAALGLNQGTTETPLPLQVGSDRGQAGTAPRDADSSRDADEARTYTITGFPAGLEARRVPGAGRRPQTAVGRSMLQNWVSIELAAAGFTLLIDDHIERLRQQLPNSAEATAARDEGIAELEDLKARVERFLGAAAEFSKEDTKEPAAVQATTSLADGIANWWTKRHVEICDKTYDMGLLLSGVTVCSLAGIVAGPAGLLAAAVSGALVGGKSVVDAIKAAASMGRGPANDSRNDA